MRRLLFSVFIGIVFLVGFGSASQIVLAYLTNTTPMTPALTDIFMISTALIAVVGSLVVAIMTSHRLALPTHQLPPLISDTLTAPRSRYSRIEVLTAAALGVLSHFFLSSIASVTLGAIVKSGAVPLAIINIVGLALSVAVTAISVIIAVLWSGKKS